MVQPILRRLHETSGECRGMVHRNRLSAQWEQKKRETACIHCGLLLPATEMEIHVSAQVSFFTMGLIFHLTLNLTLTLTLTLTLLTLTLV